MKYLSERITDYIVKSGAVSEESYAIYQYGFQIGLEMLCCFLACFGIAIYMQMIPQFLVLSCIFILLRTYAGGVHLNSYSGCFICSVGVQTAILLINHRYTFIMPMAWGIILASTVLILKNSPVENINRKLDMDEKKHCKKITIVILACIVLYSAGCTAASMNKNVSLVSLTILTVLISQYLGMIKYNFEKKRRG